MKRYLLGLLLLLTFIGTIDFEMISAKVSYVEKEVKAVVTGIGWDGKETSVVNRVVYPVFKGKGKNITKINKQIEKRQMQFLKESDALNPSYKVSYKIVSTDPYEKGYELEDSLSVDWINDKYISINECYSNDHGGYIYQDNSLLFSIETGKQITEIIKVTRAKGYKSLHKQVKKEIKKTAWSEFEYNYLVTEFIGQFNEHDKNQTGWNMNENGDVSVYLGYGTDFPTTIVLEGKSSEKTNIKKDVKKAKVGDTINFGRYEQDNNIENGAEPIEWIVLYKKKDKALLLSKDVLDFRSYEYWWENNITWETCELRDWLNRDFYSDSFNASEKSCILYSKLLTENQNEKELYYTYDSVFVLSKDDLKTKKYGFQKNGKDSLKRCTASEYAKLNVTTYSPYPFVGKSMAMWWLRDAGVGCDVEIESYNDTIYNMSCLNSKYDVNGVVGLADAKLHYGVRPAIWVSTK